MLVLNSAFRGLFSIHQLSRAQNVIAVVSLSFFILLVGIILKDSLSVILVRAQHGIEANEHIILFFLAFAVNPFCVLFHFCPQKLSEERTHLCVLAKETEAFRYTP